MLRYVDQYWPSPITIGSTAGNVMLVNGIAAGAGPNLRTNRVVSMAACEIFIVLSSLGGLAAPFSSGASSALRVMLVYDCGNNGQPTFAANTVLTVDNFMAPYQLSNSKRLRILLDETLPGFGSAGMVRSAAEVVLVFRRTVPLRGIRAWFSTGGGTLADIQSGSLYLITWQDGGVNNVAWPAQEGTTRVYFRD